VVRPVAFVLAPSALSRSGGLSLFDEINVGHDDLLRGVIYPEIEDESVRHEVGYVPAESWDRKPGTRNGSAASFRLRSKSFR
jgi:hypothetical protein